MPAVPTVTDRQRTVLGLVADGMTKQRDLMRNLGIRSSNGIRDHLDRLRTKGLVTFSPLTASVALTDLGWFVVGPCGHIAGLSKTIVRRFDIINRALESPLPDPVFCPWCGRRIPPKEIA